MKKFIIPALLVITTLFCSCAKQEPLPNNTLLNSEETNKSTTVISATEGTTPSATSTSNQTQNEPHSTAVPSPTQPQSTAKDDSLITVSVVCSCRNAVNYGIRDKKDYADFIPEDGILFSTTITVQKGSTALDAIKTAALNKNVEIKENRGYIRGIGGLYEKDCGGASGWMYSVNGTFPNVSSDKYQLNSNDKIELHYTVEVGDVA